ncbi:MAG: bifunctional DNA-formamidopyrimidine glycosylase/DNA-(apurinic or apyrimidinic site) lyase [Gammaproteobacteria bacterium]|nr:bifunctional DNA-formamidopyrimidine glycosylase/DNA-(apurinic or apyrimidinic site) lyase [Gammaproteobacteria bacterium]
MPELPEVETTLRGIRGALQGARIRLVVRERRLRWRIPAGLERRVRGQTVAGMRRRGKYILLVLERGALLIHLGMSGSFRVLSGAPAPAAHDHYDLVTDAGRIVRYRDPRRFGCLLWCGGEPLQHPRLRGLGVEPVAPTDTVDTTDAIDTVDATARAAFDGDYLRRIAAGRRITVKQFLMDSRVVVGVGNIYASEALFAAAIDPRRACHRVSAARYQKLADATRAILRDAIRRGGSTIRDFAAADGQPGYFEQELKVYGREGAPCARCGRDIRRAVIGQRSTFYCPGCQR